MDIKKIKKPLRDQVVLSKEAESNKTAGGLLFKPETVEDKHTVGMVVAVGSGRVSLNGTIVPIEVQVEDRVLFNKNMATEIKVGEQTFFVLREDQLLCVVE
jgi:chaperonin GroES